VAILVTGGAGRLGAIVVETFVGQGFSVKVFDIPQANFEQFSKYSDAQVSILKGDIADYEEVKKAFKEVDCVIHLASLLPPKSEESRDLTLRINVEGTQNIVRLLKESGSNIPLIFSNCFLAEVFIILAGWAFNHTGCLVSTSRSLSVICRP